MFGESYALCKALNIYFVDFAKSRWIVTSTTGFFVATHATLYTFPVADRDHRGRDRMVVEFTTTYAISAYHHYCGEFESRSRRSVLDTTVCGKVCQ